MDEQTPRRRGWISWLVLALLLVMAVGFWAMESGTAMPEVLETPAPSVTPLPTPTPVPTPTPISEPESTLETPEDSAEPEESTVESDVEPPPEETPELEEESEPVEIYDPEWNLRLVNRDNPIPEAYPQELWEVPGGQLVDARIYEPLMAFLQAAEDAGHGPIVVAGYRTWEKQQSIMDERVAGYLDQGYSEEEAQSLAEQWVSVPGCSEHQLGLAVDLVDASYQVLDEAQASTPAQQWLMEHCWAYGFILRYPAEKQDITGIIYEPWHYRYVGRDHAQAIRQSGQCLEEFLQAEHP